MAEETRYSFCWAAGTTIASALYTGWAFWLGDAHSRSFSAFTWLLPLYGWGIVLWERHQARRGSRR